MMVSLDNIPVEVIKAIAHEKGQELMLLHKGKILEEALLVLPKKSEKMEGNQ